MFPFLFSLLNVCVFDLAVVNHVTTQNQVCASTYPPCLFHKNPTIHTKMSVDTHDVNSMDGVSMSSDFYEGKSKDMDNEEYDDDMDDDDDDDNKSANGNNNNHNNNNNKTRYSGVDGASRDTCYEDDDIHHGNNKHNHHGDDSEKESSFHLAERENVFVRRMKIIVFLSLVLSAILLAIVTFRITLKREFDDFTNQVSILNFVFVFFVEQDRFSFVRSFVRSFNFLLLLFEN